MKRLFSLFIVCLSFICCNDVDEPALPVITFDQTTLPLQLGHESGICEISFTTRAKWTAGVGAATEWCQVTPSAGSEGVNKIKISVTENPEKIARNTDIFFSIEGQTHTIHLVQSPKVALSVSQTRFGVPASGGSFEVKVAANSPFRYQITGTGSAWLTHQATGSSFVRFAAAPNDETNSRTTQIQFTTVDGSESARITVHQLSNNSSTYESLDYSADGQIIELQRATEGNGIHIVLLGDGYSDRQIADGTYEATMRKATDAFFSEEPYKSFRHLFTVHTVIGVSRNEGYFSDAQPLFGGFFGSGSAVGGNDALCREYALKIPEVAASGLDDVLVVVMMNSYRYGGTCYLYYDKIKGDYGRGSSIAYFPQGTKEETFTQLLLHEAGGHGFAKLADEYYNDVFSRMPDEKIAEYRALEPNGWWKNVDFTADPSLIKWNWLLANPDYTNEGVGIFEGACTYWFGAYRAASISIMYYNTGGFNAPSREAIYYRIHRLSFGEHWNYSRAQFTEWDKQHRSSSPTQPSVINTPTPNHTPPVVRLKSW